MLELFLLWLLVGFLAQLIDGALGMAYGVSSTSALVSIGVYPALASASVHTAEIFTTLASGAWHFKLGNVSRNMIFHLVVPGVIGGATGAFVAVSLSSNILQLVVGCILLFMGLLILFRFVLKRVLQFRKERPSSKMLVPLGYVAAFLDALGGGGWGPIATTTLVTSKVEPNKAIGSVNFAEFFVTITESTTFIILIGPEQFSWLIILGLLIGGVICAPISALACRKLPHRILGTLVGATVIVLSTRMILKFFELA
jgi:uncharacterized membrane protein YfcA